MSWPGAGDICPQIAVSYWTESWPRDERASLSGRFVFSRSPLPYPTAKTPHPVLAPMAGSQAKQVPSGWWQQACTRDTVLTGHDRILLSGRGNFGLHFVLPELHLSPRNPNPRRGSHHTVWRQCLGPSRPALCCSLWDCLISLTLCLAPVPPLLSSACCRMGHAVSSAEGSNRRQLEGGPSCLECILRTPGSQPHSPVFLKTYYKRRCH